MSEPPIFGGSREERLAQVSDPGGPNVKTTILLVSLMCVPYLSASVIQTARVWVTCASWEDDWGESPIDMSAQPWRLQVVLWMNSAEDRRQALLLGFRA